MKVKFEKKDVIVLSVIFLIGISSYALATGWTAGNAFHTTLWANTIQAKTGNTVQVQDNLNIQGALTVYGQPVGGSGGVSVTNATINSDLSSGSYNKICFTGTSSCLNMGQVHVGYDTNGASGLDCWVVNAAGNTCWGVNGGPSTWFSCDASFPDMSNCCVNAVIDHYLPNLAGQVDWTATNGPVESLSGSGCDDTTWSHKIVTFSVNTV